MPRRSQIQLIKQQPRYPGSLPYDNSSGSSVLRFLLSIRHEHRRAQHGQQRLLCKRVSPVARLPQMQREVPQHPRVTDAPGSREAFCLQ